MSDLSFVDPLDQVELLERALAHSPAMIVLWRNLPGWPVVYASSSVQQLGYAPDDLAAGKVRWQSLIHPVDQPRLEADLRAFVQRGDETIRQEYRLITRDGRVLWVEDHSRIVRNEQGEPAFLQGFILDCTTAHEARLRLQDLVKERTAHLDEQRIWLEREVLERKRAEDALRLSEERLRVAVKAAPITLFIQDSALRYTWIYNPPSSMALPDIIGCIDDELFGDEAAPLNRIKHGVLVGGKGAQEDVCLTVGGTPHWYTLGVEPLRDEHQAVIGIICAAFDITNLKQHEAALAESEALLRTIIDCFDGMIYVSSPDHDLEFVSNQVLERTGQKCVGQKCYKTIFGQDERCPWCTAPQVLNGETTRMEVQNPVDGRWHYVVNTPVRRSDGRKSIQSVVIDITDRKMAESRQRETEAALQRAHRLESLSRMAGNIAHHINNQLTPIIGYADLAAEQLPENSPMRGHLSDIRIAANRVASLGTEMLAFSGHSFIDPQPSNMNSIILGCERLLRIASGINARLEFRLSAWAPTFLADAQQLQRALISLVQNSKEALPDAGGQIMVETGSRTFSAEELVAFLPQKKRLAGEFAFVRVSDNGIGVPTELQSRLFDPFTTNKDIGRGLGLAVTLGIVQSLDGGIKLVSQPGHGCEVTMCFPVIE